MKHIADLLQFMDSSVVNFYAVDTLSRRLEAAGFTALDMRQPWHLDRGGKYYVTQNDSALFAFIVGTDTASAGYKIISAHSDSPGFR
ncbi:MAG: M18 family aminopeptidase, partial [Muribaculaceae bacterium]